MEHIAAGMPLKSDDVYACGGADAEPPTKDQLFALLDGLERIEAEFDKRGLADTDLLAIEVTHDDVIQLKACILITLGKHHGK